MPALSNLKQEKFCQAVASGAAVLAAFIQAGYAERSAKQNSSRLMTLDVIKRRLDELQKRREERLDLTRVQLAKWLTSVIHQPSLDPSKWSDKLKAAELLTRMLGWNEPEKQQHLHQHEIVLDNSMLTQLQSAYTLTMNSLGNKQKPDNLEDNSIKQLNHSKPKSEPIEAELVK